MPFKIPVTGPHPPSLFESPLTGILYVSPVDNGNRGRWLEVPSDTVIEDIVWTPSFTVTTKATKPTVVKVKSSDGKKVYTVTTYADGKMICSCPGYTYRRFCKHTERKK